MLIPTEWMPLKMPDGRPCIIERIIVHWSVSLSQPTDHDFGSYNLLITGPGSVVQGTHPIFKNSKLWEGYGRGDYAAHVGNFNRGSVGLCLCGMVGAESPGNIGKVPLTQDQWNSAVSICAQLCKRYSIPTTVRGICGHCEVERTFGVKQGGKWDPWYGFPGIKQTAGVPSATWADLSKAWTIIGDRFRQEVAAAMTISNPIAQGGK